MCVYLYFLCSTPGCKGITPCTPVRCRPLGEPLCPVEIEESHPTLRKPCAECLKAMIPRQESVASFPDLQPEYEGVFRQHEEELFGPSSGAIDIETWWLLARKCGVIDSVYHRQLDVMPQSGDTAESYYARQRSVGKTRRYIAESWDAERSRRYTERERLRDLYRNQKGAVGPDLRIRQIKDGNDYRIRLALIAINWPAVRQNEGRLFGERKIIRYYTYWALLVKAGLIRSHPQAGEYYPKYDEDVNAWAVRARDLMPSSESDRRYVQEIDRRKEERENWIRAWTRMEAQNAMLPTKAEALAILASPEAREWGYILPADGSGGTPGGVAPSMPTPMSNTYPVETLQPSGGPSQVPSLSTTFQEFGSHRLPYGPARSPPDLASSRQLPPLPNIGREVPSMSQNLLDAGSTVPSYSPVRPFPGVATTVSALQPMARREGSGMPWTNAEGYVMLPRIDGGETLESARKGKAKEQ